jgi:hypothetical protein
MKNFYYLFIWAVITMWGQALTAQDSLNIHIKHAKGAIKVDGILEEEDWDDAQVMGNFWQFFPQDISLAKCKTQVRLTYDDQYLYFSAKCYNIHEERNYVTPSLRRDFRGEANDAVTFTIDAFQDNTNAFQFGVNPFGVQREGLVVNGGNVPTDLDLAWDNRWVSAAKQYQGLWIVEMAIPFKTLRFKEGGTQWNVKFYRVDSDAAERSVWPKVPRQFSIVNLAFVGKLIWDKPLKKPGANTVLIPYALSKYSETRKEGFQSNKSLGIGGDAKIAVGPALNLDLTVNPDFSQVEVDQQVTNLDRFEIFFPERRQFFLENADLFGEFGAVGLRPFFSRRIGVARDTSTGQNVQNSIYAGARLSGKINDKTRLGVMTMETARDIKIGQPSVNYSVVALQRKIFARSNIGLIAINKDPIKDAGISDPGRKIYNYNRVLGVDYNLASKDNKWNGKFFHHQSFSPGNNSHSGVSSASIFYNKTNFDALFTAQSVGANYNPETGYARRRNYQRFAGTVDWKFYPKQGPIQSHGPGLDFDVLGNKLYGITDWDANLLYQIKFRNTALLLMRASHEYVYLFSAFDPTNTGGKKLPVGGGYGYNYLYTNFTSDARKRIFYIFTAQKGGYYAGSRTNVDASINYRIQPFGVIAATISYNSIHQPEPYNTANLFLIGPRIDLSFSRSLFWTTFVQYNSQIRNVNINSRFQWRFRPVSDLFIVYTDNYYSDSFVNKNRALVLKFTYWLNM